MYKFFVIPDTNIWRNRQSELLGTLRLFTEHVIVAIPHLVIEEAENIFREMICYKRDRLEVFKRGLMEAIHNCVVNGLTTRVAPIPVIVGVSRVSASYVADERSSKFLEEAINMYVVKGRRYYSAVRNILSNLKKRNDVESKWIKELEEALENGKVSWKQYIEVLEYCCNTNPNSRMFGHCKNLIGTLPDILIASAALYLADNHKDMIVLVVTEDKTLCNAITELSDKYKLTVKSCSVDELKRLLTENANELVK